MRLATPERLRATDALSRSQENAPPLGPAQAYRRVLGCLATPERLSATDALSTPDLALLTSVFRGFPLETCQKWMFLALVFNRHLPDIEQWSRAMAPTSSRGGLVLA